MILIVHQIY